MPVLGADVDEQDEEVPGPEESLLPEVKERLLLENVLENNGPQDSIVIQMPNVTRAGVRQRYTLRFRMWLGKAASETLQQMKVKFPTRKQHPFLTKNIE